MRYVIFPSAQHSDGSRPELITLLIDNKINIIYGPTKSGLYLVDGDSVAIKNLKSVIEPYYIIFEDFEIVSVH
jgi:hypothetical protein